jgi:hypothetical protein
MTGTLKKHEPHRLSQAMIVVLRRMHEAGGTLDEAELLSTAQTQTFDALERRGLVQMTRGKRWKASLTKVAEGLFPEDRA